MEGGLRIIFLLCHYPKEYPKGRQEGWTMVEISEGTLSLILGLTLCLLR